MAIGPMVDSAIISLENIDRHLERGAPLRRAALDGPAEVALPELVASLSTLTVLAPLALMPSSGQFLFKPMALAVGFAMGSAYLLSRTFVPARAAGWLKENENGQEQDDQDEEDEFGQRREPRKGWIARAFDRWQAGIESGIGWYGRRLQWVLDHTIAVVAVAFVTLLLLIAILAFPLRREFFPEVDAGAFEIFVRAPSGTKLEKTNDRIAEVEDFLHQQIAEDDLKLIVSEIGVTPDWSAGYTHNAGKMDAIVRVQLTEDHQTGAYEYADQLRNAFKREERFSDLEVAFNAGGLIRGALNQGKPTPINIRVVGKDTHIAHKIADQIRRRVDAIEGVVDARIIQRLNYPAYKIDVDRAKSADLGLTQADVIKQVIAAFNSSIQFNKRIFWVDPVGGNQYFVGVQYPLEDITSLESLLNVPITGVNQTRQDRRVATHEPPELVRSQDPIYGEPVAPPIPLSNIVELTRSEIPTEITDVNLHKTIDLYVGVRGRDLGHVASDIHEAINNFGKIKEGGSSASDLGTTWQAYDPDFSGNRTLEGYDIVLSGEYARMNQAFKNLAIGLCLSIVIIYFMMVALDRSYVVPLVNLLAVPLMLIGVLPMLYLTGTSLNIQSLLGIIFVVGIQISNTVLMTDVAQEQRKSKGLSPIESIRKAALLRVRPIIMTALAAFFALIPTALALEKGSEANAPLGRAILGGLL
ncbi:MAG TPA: efflux RND transporter permease subunit, partial [Isosphaeraceae bacterium]|nr:efflux RND transporter permease subunit [Isosphaeraceae bacterium]